MARIKRMGLGSQQIIQITQRLSLLNAKALFNRLISVIS